MRPKSFVLVLACLVLIATILVQIQEPITNGVSNKIESAGTRQAANLHVVETYGKLPLSFETNQGQTDSQVKFLSRGNGYNLFLTSTEAVLSLKKSGDIQTHDPKGAVKPSGETKAVVRMKLIGANTSPQVTGIDELPGKSNYFIGNDPSKWRTNVPTYAKVRYENVYSGIDLVYYGNQRQLEYDFVVSPGADPRAIRLAIDGEEKLQIDGQGDLVLEAEGSELRLHRPVIYQENNGTKECVGGDFVIKNANEVGFEVARYDASKPLIIDPILSYSTYLGGSGGDRGVGIAVDSSGNAYVTGLATSINFPTANAFQAAFGGPPAAFLRGDAFVTKLNAAGSALVYSTYLGGSGDDSGQGIAVDSSGNAYVTGFTRSTDFPTKNAFQAAFGGGFENAFVTKLNAAGSALVYSTYLGGSGSDVGNGIAVDSSGNAYVAGTTDSTNFPTANAFQAVFGGAADAFMTKLNAAGSALVNSTYLGGSGYDSGSGIAVDSSGNAYVTGSTSSTNFPTANAFQAVFRGGAQHAFVTKLNAAGAALAYSTYLGGSGYDSGSGIAVDSFGNAYVTGSTYSIDFPATANAFQSASSAVTCFDGVRTYDCYHAFVTKLNAAGSALIYATYLGGSNYDSGSGIAVDISGNAYVTGGTLSIDFPTTANAFQATHGDGSGPGVVFVTKLNLAGSALVYSTYLGGSGGDLGFGIAVDSSGNAYVTGQTSSTNFPTANAFQAQLLADVNAFVTKIADNIPPPPAPVITSLTPSSAAAGGPAFTLTVSGSNFAVGATVQWNGGNRATTFVSATQLTVAIAAGDLAAAGTALVTVVNPAPGGGTSKVLNFVITGPIVPPTVNANGTVNGASFAQQALAAGSIASVFGTGFAISNASAGNVPLPTTLGGATVRLNGILAPLFAVTPQQINFQVPWELAGQTQASLTVTTGGGTTAPVTVSLANLGPGLFSINASGAGQGAILIANTAAIAAPVGTLSGSRPALRGEIVSIYATGLGPVSNPPASGAATPTNSPAFTTTTPPAATIGGVATTVTFAGLAPGFAGLYQVNVQVPQNVTPGNAVPVVLSYSGPGGIGTAVISNTVTIAVAGSSGGSIGAITEYPLPTAVANSAAGSITAGSDGALWFTEPQAGKIGRITTSGVITEFPAMNPAVPAGSGAYGITTGPDGALWFTQDILDIGRITTSGAFSWYPAPSGGNIGSVIATGPDGAIWFTEQFSSGDINIFRMTTAGAVTNYPLPPAASASLDGITAGPDGALWMTHSSNFTGPDILRVTTAGEMISYPIPITPAGLAGITVGPDGALWFTENTANKIGRITTSGEITEYPLSSPAGPGRITAGQDGTLWFIQTSGNRIGRITTSGVITEYPVPTVSAGLADITAGPDGALWFTESGRIGRLDLGVNPQR